MFCDAKHLGLALNLAYNNMVELLLHLLITGMKHFREAFTYKISPRSNVYKAEWSELPASDHVAAGFEPAEGEILSKS